MTDPYNNAESTTPLAEIVSNDAANERRPARTSIKRPAAPPSTSLFRDFFPVWNVIALIAGLTWTVKGAPSHIPILLLVYGPLVLAIAAGAWISSPGFALLVRAVNALIAVWIIVKLLKYVGAGILTLNMVTVFFMTALMPILNALFLRPRAPK